MTAPRGRAVRLRRLRALPKQGPRFGDPRCQHLQLAAGVFLLVNAPFVAWNPSAWAAAMFAPLTSLQAPTGLGLSSLAAYGYVFVRRDLFVVAEVGLLAVLAVGYHVHFERLEFTLWIFPALVLFVSYRMLQSYVVYWAPFLVVGLWMWWRTHANSNP